MVKSVGMISNFPTQFLVWPNCNNLHTGLNIEWGNGLSSAFFDKLLIWWDLQWIHEMFDPSDVSVSLFFLLFVSLPQVVRSFSPDVLTNRSPSLPASYGACSTKTKALERTNSRWSWLVIWNTIYKSAICGLVEPVLSRAPRFRQACAVRS